MTRLRSLTAAAHLRWQSLLQPGDRALDATCGNGHDTAFLTRLVGPQGRVFALDIQAEAIARTASRVQAEGVPAALACIHGDHAALDALLPPAPVGSFQLVAFNLGYLPGGDHAVTTQAPTTLAALQAATRHLAPGGALSIIAYTGHPGGAEECQAVRAFALDRAREGWPLEIVHLPDNPRRAPPVFFWLRRPPVAPTVPIPPSS